MCLHLVCSWFVGSVLRYNYIFMLIYESLCDRSNNLSPASSEYFKSSWATDLTVSIKKAKSLSYPLSAHWRLWSDWGICPGWFESSLDAGPNCLIFQTMTHIVSIAILPCHWIRVMLVSCWQEDVHKVLDNGFNRSFVAKKACDRVIWLSYLNMTHHENMSV